MVTRSAILISACVVLVACGGSTDNPGTCVAPYAATGSHTAGLAALSVGGNPVAVWYPSDQSGATRASYDLRDWLPASEKGKIPDSAKPAHDMEAFADLPIASGKFPVVLFSHGLGGYRFQSSFLMTHLASWGFIVIAPEHPERNLTAALNQMFTGDQAPQQLRDALAAVKADARFAAHLDLDHIAVTGHSAGGGAVSTVSPDADIKAWVMLASAGLGSGPEGKPSLLMCGSTDEFGVCNQVRNAWRSEPPPSRFVQIAGAGHLAFTDLCTIAVDQGGIVKLAQTYGVTGASDLLVMLASDGCRPTDLPATQAWPLIDHYVVAHLRAAFGIDASLVGFDAKSGACFGPRLGEAAELASTASPDQGVSLDMSMPQDGGSSDAAMPNDDVGKVNCNGTKCTLPDVCCVSLAGSSCKAASSCTGLVAPQACDGPEDCTGGKVCCAGFPQGASCKTSCQGSESTLCHANGDCAQPATCRPCQFPGGPPTLVCSTGC